MVQRLPTFNTHSTNEIHCTMKSRGQSEGRREKETKKLVRKRRKRAHEDRSQYVGWVRSLMECWRS